MLLVNIQSSEKVIRFASFFPGFMEGLTIFTDIAFSASHGIKMGECLWESTCLTCKNENSKVLLQKISKVQVSSYMSKPNKNIY